MADATSDSSIIALGLPLVIVHLTRYANGMLAGRQGVTSIMCISSASALSFNASFLHVRGMFTVVAITDFLD